MTSACVKRRGRRVPVVFGKRRGAHGQSKSDRVIWGGNAERVRAPSLVARSCPGCRRQVGSLQHLARRQLWPLRSLSPICPPRARARAPRQLRRRQTEAAIALSFHRYEDVDHQLVGSRVHRVGGVFLDEQVFGFELLVVEIVGDRFVRRIHGVVRAAMDKFECPA